MPLVDSRGFQLTPDLQQTQQGLRLGLQAQQVGINNRVANAQLQQNQFNQGTRQLSGQVLGGGGDQEKNLAALFQRDPEAGQKVFEMLGARTQSQREEAAFFAFQLENTPPERRPGMIQSRVQSLESTGRDATQTKELLGMDSEGQDQALKVIQLASLSPEKRAEIAGGKGSIKSGFDEQGSGFFNVTPQGATRIPGAVPKQAGGAEERDVQSSKILPGGLVQMVFEDGSVAIKSLDQAESDLVRQAEQRGVDLQADRAKGRRIGTETAKISTEVFDQSGKLRSNNETLRQVVAEVKAGAGVGPLKAKLPSIRASSVRLDNLRTKLGLDVIGSVTFGALSKGELMLALDKALPTKLEPQELIDWAESKISAQEKLAVYLEDQAVFLSAPGNTVADWIERSRTEAEQQAQPLAAPDTKEFVLMEDAAGNRALVGPNGEVKEAP